MPNIGIARIAPATPHSASPTSNEISTKIAGNAMNFCDSRGRTKLFSYC
ncbi:MAG: hypothetical protein WA103_01980 [Minisyncoccales bacterium]